MKIIADLHFHSKYSRAVSPQMILPEMTRWAKLKGIDLLTTSDFTHPLWLRELKAGLEEVGEGIYKLKSKTRFSAENLPKANNSKFATKEPLFLLTTEISSIYTQAGKLRRIHNLIFAPNLTEAEKIETELAKRGNVMSDGRPIFGLTAREIADLILNLSPQALIIPAHAWTPHFSLYGSQSGFDSIEECFGNMAKYIYAVETGLSSDPAMNWRIGELDNRSIISCSDAHSGAKLGREVTVFEVEDTKRLRYEDIRKAIIQRTDDGRQRTDSGKTEEIEKTENLSSVKSAIRLPSSVFCLPRIAYTIEFYPEEGKYHYTGHRNCGVRHSPEETKKLGEACPVCGRHLTVGVMHRVQQLQHTTYPGLAKRSGAGNIQHTIDEKGVKWFKHPEKNRPPYVMLVPLLEILAEALGTTVSSQKAINEYKKLTEELGGEFKVLLEVESAQIAKIAGLKVAEGIKKVRSGEIMIEPGYDGVFGIVKIWSFAPQGGAQDKSLLPEQDKEQMALF